MGRPAGPKRRVRLCRNDPVDIPSAAPKVAGRNPMHQVISEEEPPPSSASLTLQSDSPRLVPALKKIPRIGPASLAYKRAFHPDASDKDWNDWHWQAKNRLKTLEQIERVIELSDDERAAIQEGGSMLPIGITPYYMSLLSRTDARQGLRRTVIPSRAEFVRLPGEADDPLAEDSHTAAPGIVHRYPDRVLFLALDYCTTYCRYCTRSRVVGQGEITASTARLEQAIDYIRRNTMIRDVLISGGDPLSLKDEKLDWILTKLREIPHLEFVRIGTKMPAVLPQRITPALIKMLKKHHPLWMSVHFLHPDECTPEALKACSRLADAGIPLGCQTVLLKGVNDDVEVMKRLMHRLLMMRVRPYYLYQCDPISGSAHFRTTVEKGLEIIRGLRGHTTGYAVPQYVIDAPGGGGKIPLQPEYLVGRDGDDLVLRNFEGRTFRYPDPIGEEADHGRPRRVALRTLREAPEDLLSNEGHLCHSG
jgi:lysine 2,3-aminomutase